MQYYDDFFEVPKIFDLKMVEEVEIESTAQCLQSIIATLEHAPPYVGNDGIEPSALSLSGKYSTGELIANMCIWKVMILLPYPYEGSALPIELQIHTSITDGARTHNNNSESVVP